MSNINRPIIELVEHMESTLERVSSYASYISAIHPEMQEELAKAYTALEEVRDTVAYSIED